MPRLRSFGLAHCAIAVVAFLVLMALTFAMNLTILIANTLLLPEPTPFVLWATCWYLLLCAVVWVVDVVGGP